MDSSKIPQRKRLAMGLARGGSVSAKIDVAKPVNVASGGASQLTMSRRNNGVPGMKKGGRACK